MMIIVAVEESPLLLAVSGVVGRVEVEDQVLRRLGVGGDKLVDEDSRDADQRLAIDAVFQSAKGRRRGECRLGFGRLPGGKLEGGIGAEGLVVIQVFVAQ